MRVLIAQGERDKLVTLGILIRSEGNEVELVERGAQVEAAVEQFRPDVVLLDLGMRDRSGLQVAVDLATARGDTCPVLIALSDNNSEMAKRLTAKAGFRHHVAKPYDPDALLQLLASVGRKSS